MRNTFIYGIYFVFSTKSFIIPPLPGRGGGGYTVLPLSVQEIFRHIFLSNYLWQKSDIRSFKPEVMLFIIFNVLHH